MTKQLLLSALALLSASLVANAQCSAPNIGSAPVTINASGSSVVITSTNGRSIHLCTLSVGFASPVSVTLQATTSGGAQNALSGAYPLTSGNLILAVDFHGAVQTGVGNAFSINLSSAVAGGGIVTFYTTPYN
jgi:hypothetical protein